jgi:hypothetical protein
VEAEGMMKVTSTSPAAVENKNKLKCISTLTLMTQKRRKTQNKEY